MRNRNLIIVALLLLCTQTLWSQKIDQHLDMDNMSFFKEATMVVEGRFLKPVFSYAVKDIQGKEHYYGICPVIAYKVFKGNAKAGDTLYVTQERKSLLSPPPLPIKFDTVYCGAEGMIVDITDDSNWDILYAMPLIASSK